MQQILRIDNLHKTYGHGDVFRDVSFTLNSGETLGLFGMSGSGKSTLGRCILRLERVSGGRIIFSGNDITRSSEREIKRFRPFMQMIFQHPEMSLNPRMRLMESVTEPLCYYTKREPEEVFERLLPLISAVGLHESTFSCYPSQLSGGEIQRAMMVRIYSLSPKLIVADEPTSMLDMSVQAQILVLMKKLQSENDTACLFISHDPDVMVAMCDRIGVLKDGRFLVVDKEDFSGSAEI